MVVSKNEKESYVTGYNGTDNALEILWLCSIVPLGYLFYYNIILLSSSTPKEKSVNRNSDDIDHNQHQQQRLLWRIGIEWIGIWLPILCFQTKFIYPYGMILYIFMILSCIIITTNKKTTAMKDQVLKHRINTATTATSSSSTTLTSNCDIITIYRSCLLLLTCIAILAVDFPIIYPRKYIKTEISGYSLMDLGASSFVFSSGFTSSRIRHATSANQSNHHRVRSLSKLFRKVLPVFGMGLVRFITHTNIEYQEHITEYGIHWNFFFTLTWLAILSNFIIPLTQQQQKPNWYVPLSILLFYQILLSYPTINVQSWIISSSRKCSYYYDYTLCHWTKANREGILGCISYASLYLLSEKISYETIWKYQYPQQQSQRDTGSSSSPSKLLFKQSILWTMIWIILVHVCDIPVSRRSTNMSFCIWTIVINLWQITLLQLIYDYYCDKGINRHFIKAKNNDNDNMKRETNNSDERLMIGAVPYVLQAMNRNGLLIFVIANLMTGIINLSINTIYISSEIVAIVIIIIYLFMISLLSVSLDRIFSMMQH